MKMDAKSRSLGNFLSTIASNFWYCPTNHGDVDCRLLPTYWLQLRPQGGEVPTIPIRTVVEVSTTLISLQISPGVLLLTPTLLNCHGVLLIHALPDATSATTYFVAGVNRVCGANIISAIPWSIHGFIDEGNTWMVR